MRAHRFWLQPTYVNSISPVCIACNQYNRYTWLQTLQDQSVHSGRRFRFFFLFCFFFGGISFLHFLGKKYDEIGKNRGYLALGMGPNFSPAEQAENALVL